MMNLKLIGLVSKLNFVKLAVIAAAFLIAAGVALNANISSAATQTGREKSESSSYRCVKVFFSPRCSNCHPAGDGPRKVTQVSCTTPK